MEIGELISCIEKGPDADAAIAARDFVGKVNTIKLLGCTAMTAAVEHVRVETLKALSRRDDIRPSLQDGYGDTPLHTAVMRDNGCAEVLLQLFPKLDIDAVSAALFFLFFF